MSFRSKRLAIAAAFFATTFLTATISAETEVSFPHPLSDSGEPGGLLPQGEDDIRRTAEAVFGFALSEEQLDRTRHWRTTDLTWWTDPAREQMAQQTTAKIYRLSGLHFNFGATQNALRSSSALFGVEVQAPDSGENRTLVLSLDPRMRPDLVSYKRTLLSLLESFYQATNDSGEPDIGLFLELFPAMVRPLFQEPENPLTAAAFLQEVEAGLEHYERLLETHRDQIVVPILQAHGLNHGATFDLDAYEELEISDEIAHTAALNAAIDELRRRLWRYDYPGDLTPFEALLKSVVEKFLPLSPTTLLVMNRSARIEAATALKRAFVNAAREGHTP
ncbi:MAG: hypothetical protein AAF604_15630 [Acidobacteriota bacterium]